MRIIKPKWVIECTPNQARKMISDIERYAGTCYKGRKLPTIGKLISLGHLGVLEHKSITAIVTCDRGVTHEIVRHRLASYLQESTRYCNYSNDRFGSEIVVIEPIFFKSKDGAQQAKYVAWKRACEYCEHQYMELLSLGASAQEARTVLPNSLKSEIVMTLNLRAWKHFFSLRWLETTGPAHPQMKEITCGMYKRFSILLPQIFS
jgi:thymidylate synthase (FAD)